jgi:hypothetical protein
MQLQVAAFRGASRRSFELADQAGYDGEFSIEMPIAQSRSLPQENAGSVHYKEPITDTGAGSTVE